MPCSRSLEAQARDDLHRDGFAENEVRIDRALDMRYAGQGYEITMSCTAEEALALAVLREPFDAEHKSQFGHMAPEEPVEVVSYRVRGVGLVPAVRCRNSRRKAKTFRCAAGNTASALRRRDGFLPGLSARETRCRLDLARTGDPRSIRLHHRDLRRPDRALDEWKN